MRGECCHCLGIHAATVSWILVPRAIVLSMILGWPGARNSVMVLGGEIKAGSSILSPTQLTSFRGRVCFDDLARAWHAKGCAGARLYA